jgi:hypothetical protein
MQNIELLEKPFSNAQLARALAAAWPHEASANPA